jgi:hypothetical protein
MARETGHSVRTVQRWAAGTSKPRARVYADLLAIAATRVSTLGGLMSKLQAAKS